MVNDCPVDMMTMTLEFNATTAALLPPTLAEIRGVWMNSPHRAEYLPAIAEGLCHHLRKLTGSDHPAPEVVASFIRQIFAEPENWVFLDADILKAINQNLGSTLLFPQVAAQALVDYCILHGVAERCPTLDILFRMLKTAEEHVTSGSPLRMLTGLKSPEALAELYSPLFLGESIIERAREMLSRDISKRPASARAFTKAVTACGKVESSRPCDLAMLEPVRG